MSKIKFVPQTSTSLQAADVTPPVITIIGDNPMTLVQNQTYNEPGATAQDNEDGTVPVNTSGSVNTAEVGTNTITYTAVDEAGNSTTATRTVNITDGMAPVITILGDNPMTLLQNQTYNEPGATAQDNEDGNVAATPSGSVDTSVIGTNTITYTATDSTGNSSTATRTVNVTDGVAPVITILGDNPMSIPQNVDYNEPGATAQDNEDGNVTAYPSGSVNTSEVGTNTITYTATDSAGNSTTATRTVNVTDGVAPVITILGDNPMALIQNSTYNEPGATAQDDEDGNVAATPSGSVNTSEVGTNTITYTATDSTGNSSTATRTVNITDGVAPVITITGDNPMTLIQNSTYNEPGATAQDNEDGNVTAYPSGSVNTSEVGTNTITYTATDVAGNSATATRTVNITDGVAPVITILGANPLSLLQNSTYNEPGATAQDNEDGNVAATPSGSVDTSVIGTNTITYTAIDAAGNSSTATRTVNVTDGVAPVITILGDNPMSIKQNVDYNEPGATAQDAYDGNVNVYPSGSVNNQDIGTNTITYTATDAANNSATSTRTVNVTDGVAPVITIIGDANYEQERNEPYNDPGATAVDTVDDSVPVTIGGDTVDTSTVGDYTVTYTATDSAGNSSTRNRVVTVFVVPVWGNLDNTVDLVGDLGNISRSNVGRTLMLVEKFIPNNYTNVDLSTYTRSGSIWTKIGEVRFPYGSVVHAVAISPDGLRMAVPVQPTTHENVDYCSVFLYSLSGGVWTQTQEIIQRVEHDSLGATEVHASAFSHDSQHYVVLSTYRTVGDGSYPSYYYMVGYTLSGNTYQEDATPIMDEERTTSNNNNSYKMVIIGNSLRLEFRNSHTSTPRTKTVQHYERVAGDWIASGTPPGISAKRNYGLSQDKERMIGSISNAFHTDEPISIYNTITGEIVSTIIPDLTFGLDSAYPAGTEEDWFVANGYITDDHSEVLIDIYLYDTDYWRTHVFDLATGNLKEEVPFRIRAVADYPEGAVSYRQGTDYRHSIITFV
jgi:phage gpG-like protein